MKRLLYILLLFSFLSVHAISLDNRSRAIIDQLKLTQKQQVLNEKHHKSATNEDVSIDSLYYPVIIKLSNDSVLDDLLSLGTIIYHKRNEFILASIPYSQLETVSRLPLVNRMSLSKPLSVTLDKAKSMTNVDKLHSALDLPQAYNGEGVVVGISDIGFDPSHVAFSDGRLKRLVCYEELQGKRYDMSIEQEISSWETDDSTEWHACHVAGILAGNDCGNGYSGVATKSEMGITTSNLYEMAILSGVEDVIEYAKKVGRPAVINMSVGHNLGPHDGSSLFNQYLERVGEEAIVCLSAGNDGNKRVYIPFDATKDGDELRTFVYDNPNVCGIKMQGAIDLWSIDSRRFLIALTIYDRITKEFVYTSPFVGEEESGDASSWGIASSSLATENDVSIPLFESELKGAVRVYFSTNIDNGRYNVYATVDVENHQRDESGLLGRYCIGFIMRADKDVHIDAYADASRVIFHSLGVPGFTGGDPSRSISDLACGKNVIAVGASNSRNTTPQVDGGIKTYNFNENEVAYFSSYGTLDDGRVLPHFCAPGNMIVAPISTKYTERFSEESLKKLAVKSSMNGRDYYWISECGTSMASPHAAGVIACWLQADSSLTVNEILDIAQSTANTSYADYPNPQWGAGNINAYAGMKEVLKRAGVGNVLAENSYKMILNPIGSRQFEVYVPNSEIKDVQIFSISGQNVFSTSSTIINATTLPMGVYIIKVLHSKGELMERILIK